MAWAFVTGQSKSIVTLTSHTTQALAFPGNVTATNSLWAFVRWAVGSGSATFSDNNSGSWATDKTVNDGPNGTSASVGHAFSHNAGATTVTATFGSNAFIGMAIHEYSGVASLDTTAGQTATFTNAADNDTSGTATTGATGDLNVGVTDLDAATTGTITVGTGETQRETQSNGSNVIFKTEDKNVVSSGASTASTFTLSTGQGAIAIMSLFKQTVASGFQPAWGQTATHTLQSGIF